MKNITHSGKGDLIEGDKIINSKENIVSIVGNSNIVIQDTERDSITIVFETEKLKDTIEKYIDELKITKDEGRKQQIEIIFKLLEEKLEPFRKSLKSQNIIVKKINKTFSQAKVNTYLLVFIISFLLLSIIAGITYFKSDNYLLNFQPEEYLFKYRSDSTKFKNCDRLATSIFFKLPNNLEAYKSFEDIYCKQKFQICKVLKDSIANMEFIQCTKQKDIDCYTKYKDKYDSTYRYYKDCWDNIILIEYENLKSNYISYYNFKKKYEQTTFQGHKEKLESILNKINMQMMDPYILLKGTWECKENGELWVFENNKKMKRDGINYFFEFEGKYQMNLIGDKEINFRIVSLSYNKTILKDHNNNTITLNHK